MTFASDRSAGGRIAAILALPEAAGCPQMARRLAHDTAVSPDVAREALIGRQASIDAMWADVVAKLNATLPGGARPGAGDIGVGGASRQSSDDIRSGITAGLNASLPRQAMRA